MSKNTTEKRTVVTVYGCGGTGVNHILHSTGTPLAEQESGLYPMMKYVGIDSSASNCRNYMDAADAAGIPIHLLAGEMGFGMNRPQAVKKCSPHIIPILRDYPPTDFNILIGSAGGGTGSVLVPLIANQLLERNIPFIIMLVGSRCTSREAQNTLDTLTGIRNAARKHQTPIELCYFENGKNDEKGQDWVGTIPEVDRRMDATFRSNLLLLAGTCERLDNTDVRNFLDYTSVVSSDIAPQLVRLIPFVMDGENAPWSEYARKTITSVNLMRSPGDDEAPVDALYGTVGLYGEDTHPSSIPNYAFITTTEGVSTIFSELKAKVEMFKEIEEELTTTDVDEDWGESLI